MDLLFTISDIFGILFGIFVLIWISMKIKRNDYGKLDIFLLIAFIVIIIVDSIRLYTRLMGA